MASKPTLIIRSDASSEIGAGHISRCISLGKAWNRHGGRTTILSSEITCSMKKQANNARICVSKTTALRGTWEDAIGTANFAKESDCDWLALDGYCFGSDYQEYVRGSVQRVFIIDDQVIEGRFYCDLLLNQNIGANAADYRDRIEPNTTLILGPTYGLIAPKFCSRRNCVIQVNEPKKRVTICLGGGNSIEASRLILDAFDLVEDELFEIVILFPEGNKDMLLKGRKLSKHQINVVADWNQDVVEFLKTSTLGVVGGGHTMLEFICAGVPIAVLIVADNQRPAVSRFEKEGVVCNLGQLGKSKLIDISIKLSYMISNLEKSEEMSVLGRHLVDGHGTDRVVKKMMFIR